VGIGKRKKKEREEDEISDKRNRFTMVLSGMGLWRQRRDDNIFV